MPRKLHDSFVKEWMQELLTDFGTVETEVEIEGEVCTIDVLYYPDPQCAYPLEPLGLFGRILSQPTLIEAFRNAVSDWDIRNCKGKLWRLEGELRRKAKREGRSPHRIKPPLLWIITPTLSKSLQARFVPASTHASTPNWGEGIYFLLEGESTAIMVIHQLPKTLETLWLRLLGRGSVQEEAINTLFALPKDHPYRTQTLERLSILQINLKARQNKTKDIKEVIMGLSPVYEKWREETLSQGRQEGRTSLVELLLTQKSGSLSDRTIQKITQLTSQQCERLAIALGGIPTIEALDQWFDEKNSLDGNS